jgi:surfactin synthase thioesterase subunit
MFPVQLPGRENRIDEPCRSDSAGLCSELTVALGPYFGEKTAFFGHSMGGLLAFKLAAWLAEKGRPAPVHLFLSAAPTPVENMGLQGAGEEDFLDRILSSGSVPKGVLCHEETLAAVRKALLGDHALLTDMLDGSERKVDIPFSLFAGQDDRMTPLAMVQGWNRFTTNVCSLTTYPGGHFFIRRRQMEMADQIARTLMLYTF